MKTVTKVGRKETVMIVSKESMTIAKTMITRTVIAPAVQTRAVMAE